MKLRSRLSGRSSHAVVVAALVFAMTGGAFAAGHYVITSTKQISPKVRKALKGDRGHRGRTGARGKTGARGPQGTPGTSGTNGTGPAVTAINTNGFTTTTASDTDFHPLATVAIPAAGSWTAAGKTVVSPTGGTNKARVECELVAHTTGASDATDDVDVAMGSVDTSGSNTIAFADLATVVAHTFTGPGVIVLQCQQNGLLGGGAFLQFTDARVVATRATSLTTSR